MIKNDSYTLGEELQRIVKTMTPAEIGKFRAELLQRLPVVIDQAAKAAQAPKPEAKKANNGT